MFLKGGAVGSAIEKLRGFLPPQVIKFVIAGGTVAVTELSLLYLFTDIFHIWYLSSLILAFIVSFIVSFTLQKLWTFQDRGTKTIHIQASSYLAVALTNLALNTALLYIAVRYLGVWYLLAQALISVLIAAWSFLVYKLFIFRKKSSPET